MKSRIGAVALYTALWSVVAKYRKWPFSAPPRTKTLYRSKQKFVQLIMSAVPPSRPKFIMIGWGVAAPHISEVVVWRRFFPVTSRASAQPTPSVRVPHNIYQTTRFWPRMCFLGDFIDTSHPTGSYPQNPSFWGRQWGFPASTFTGVSRHRRNVS
jgi:hypothetical protein